MGVIISRAAATDAEAILALQQLAYQSEAAIYQDYAIAPLIQTLPEMKAEMQVRLFLKAVAEGHIVGSVRAHLEQGTCYIGRLIVHPDQQNRGLGQELMREIEDHFPQSKRYELFTGHRSERNLYFYQKLGYQQFKTQKVSEKLTMVFLEKNL